MTEREKEHIVVALQDIDQKKINLSPKVIMSALEEKIRRAYADGFYVSISGMAPE